MEVSAKNKDSREVSVVYDFGETLAETTEKFGENVTFNHSRGSMIVSLQSYIRAQISAGKTDEEIQNLVSAWKPSQRKQGKTPKEKLQEYVSKLSAEDRAEFLKEFKASQRNKEAA